MNKRIGLIGYVNHSGLGVIAASFRKHFSLDSQFIIKHPIKDVEVVPDAMKSLIPGTMKSLIEDGNRKVYDIGIPHTFGDLEPTIGQFNGYLDTCKPEVVIVVETPFNFDFFKIMYDRGIKVVFIPMIDSISVEKFIPYEKYIDLVINFTKIGHKIYLDKWPGCGIHLSYPIDTEYFNSKRAAEPRSFIAESRRTQYTFLHSSGWGGAGFRKGTDLIPTAFKQLEYKYKNEISLSILGQPGEQQHNSADRTFFHIVNLAEAIDLYRDGKIFICSSRREGLGLPILEAMACGLPVITTDASPMNEWFPEDYPLLVKVQCQTDLPYGDVPMYTPNAYDLMQKMEFAYKNPELMEQIGEANRIIIQEKYSWDVLRDTYLEFLNR